MVPCGMQKGRRRVAVVQREAMEIEIKEVELGVRFDQCDDHACKHASLLDEANEFPWPMCIWAPSVVGQTRLVRQCAASFATVGAAVVGALAACVVWRLVRGASSTERGGGILGVVKALAVMVVCLLLDVFGVTSHCIPAYGTLSDVVFGPFGGLLLAKMFGSRKLGLAFAVKEVMLLTDVVPLATMAWLARYAAGVF